MYTSCMRVLLFHSLHISPQSWIRMLQCNTRVLYGCGTACRVKVCQCVRVVLSGCGACPGTMGTAVVPPLHLHAWLAKQCPLACGQGTGHVTPHWAECCGDTTCKTIHYTHAVCCVCTIHMWFNTHTVLCSWIVQWPQLLTWFNAHAPFLMY